MSLFGSLFTGVSALSAQSQATAIISNNIANVNTTGFKRSEAAFESLVTTESRSSRYSPGTVKANRLQRVDQQGPIQQSISSTDVAISGNGFFAIKTDSLDSGLTPFLYTRNGQFSEDAQGFLRNSAGFYLYGWPIDQEGNLPTTNLDTLVPVDAANLNGITRPTTTAEIAINLDAREPDVTINAATAVDFQRGMTVYDSLGRAQQINFEFVKSYGPMGTAASNRSNLLATDELIADLNLAAGDTFEISVDGGAAVSYEIIAPGGTAGAGNTGVATIADIINNINTDFANLASVYLGNNGELILQRDDFLGSTASFITLEDTTGSPLADLGLTAAAGGTNYRSTSMSDATYNHDNGTPADTPEYSSETFPSFLNYPSPDGIAAADTNYNPRGWWDLIIRDPSGNIISQGMLNFNRDGSINALSDADGEVDIELTGIDWGNGSALQNINVDVSRFTQFGSDYTVFYSDQNGAELGLRTGVSIDEEGFVVAQFSNGETSRIYKIPLVTFSNPNGLQEISGTAYAESEESGTPNPREAGSGGSGKLETSTLEISNVDLADEFSRLIIAQRAYSAGTKIINTVDQMTEELLRLR